jgi:hypothetical protein
MFASLLCIGHHSVKAYHEQAVAAGIPALTTAGIYPGTSNVMAAHIVSISRGEYDENWQYKDNPTGVQLEATGQRGGVLKIRVGAL